MLETVNRLLLALALASLGPAVGNHGAWWIAGIALAATPQLVAAVAAVGR